jgi:hypothetical protein
MKKYISVISLAPLLIAAAAFGTEPTAPPKAAPAAAVGTPVPTAPTSIDKEKIANAAHALGYKTHTQEGKTVYCRSENKVGSNLPTTTCLTEEQVMGAMKRSEGNMDSIEAMQRAWLVGAPSKEPSIPIGAARGQ